jgi:hypothetical protein
MKSVGGYITLVVLLVAAGGVAWFAGKSEERLAAAEYSLVTLRYERAATELREATTPGLLDPVVRRLSPIASDETASAQYWTGDDEELDSSEDPAVKLLAANAEYRALRRTGAPWQAAVGRLDAIAKRYADVIRLQPDNEDAAYNYEFVLRVRATIAGSKQALVPADPAATGLTVHGVPGAPPEESDAKKFKMIVPMLPDERQEAEEAGRAARKIRKG